MKSIFISTCLLTATSVFSQTISLTGIIYTQNFNTLSSTAGSTTNSLPLTGWSLFETGGGGRDNEQYAVETGASTTGDTYSYGASANSDRALGGLRTGILIPLFGAGFTNNTGTIITTLRISYTGEEWRLGTLSRTDRLNFEYSTDASGISTGTWTNASALNFTTPTTTVTGAKDGNNATNRIAISDIITGLNIVNGATFYIRWTDIDATSADDGLAVDDFSLETNVSLPLTLVNFSATKEDASTKISWVTTEEINTALFKVQRSTDDVGNWQTIATVKASGQSSTLLKYEVIDATPGKGENYYRLMSLDLDDRFTYSAIRRVNFNKQYTIGVYPNPVKNILHITTDQAAGLNGNLILQDIQGQIVLRKRVTDRMPAQQLNMALLKSGIYILRIITDNGNVSSIKVVRE